MRILIVSPYLGDLFGQEQVVRASVSLLRGAGHSVFLMCDTVSGGAPVSDGLEEIRGLSTINLRTPRQIRKDLHGRAKTFIEQTAPDVIHLIDQFDPTLVRWMTKRYAVCLSAHAVVHTCPAGSRLIPPSTLCTRRSGWACLWHDVYQKCLTFPGIARKAYAVLESRRRRSALRKVHLIVAVSHYIRRGLLADGWPVDRIETIYNPVFPAKDKAQLLDDAAPTIAAAARLVPLKGIGLLLNALAKMQDVPWIFKLAGEGLERPALEKQAVVLGIAERVHFLGRLPQTEVHELFKSARVVVHPSVGPEAFGLAPAEASAMGVPVVVFKVPALDEIIQDQANGRTVRAGDTAALTQVLRELVTNVTAARALGQRGPSLIAERFSPERHLKLTESAYQICMDYAGRQVAETRARDAS